MKTAIIIPARYASTRFPGKPLAKIAGRSMLSRVVDIGRRAITGHDNVTLMVATNDQRIADHCREIGVECVMTSDECPTGSDRVLEAAQKSSGGFDFLVSLQGDAPFTPAEALSLMLEAAMDNPGLEVVTPVIRLRWSELEALREAKKTTPFSGTTVTIGPDGHALWFSKNIIPAIRKEKDLRGQGEFSPVYQHLGLYGYRTDVLERYVRLPQGHYEQLEGLEQLRLLENEITVHTVEVGLEKGLVQSGIDSPEDLARAEALIKAHGERM